MTDHIRWGILATGDIAHMFTSDLRMAGLDVTAVGSSSSDKAHAFAKTYDIAHAHGSYQTLVDDDDVDVIYVATPHAFHAENAMMALRAGKHVLVEKAFTLNAEQAAEVVDYGADHGLLVQEAMWTRFLPHMRRVRELIANGTLGDVRTVLADHDQKLPLDPTHRLQNPDLGGGALLDLGIYPVSFAWDVFGAPSKVMSMSTPTATGVDGQTAIVLGYPEGRQAVLHAELDAEGPTVASVIGTDARIDIDSVWYSPTTFTVQRRGGEVLERFEHPVKGRGMQYQAFAVEQALREGRTTTEELPASESLQIMSTLDEVRRQIGLRYPGEAL